PADIVMLATLQPIAPAQDPVLGHVFADGAQSAKNLPGPVNIIHAPASVPGTVVVLRLDQVTDRLADRALFRVEIDVAKQLERACRQVAAGRVENGVVIGERHVFKPMLRDILVERRPAAVPALEAELPRDRALEERVERRL